jgi:hypothetical protein
MSKSHPVEELATLHDFLTVSKRAEMTLHRGNEDVASTRLVS